MQIDDTPRRSPGIGNTRDGCPPGLPSPRRTRLAVLLAAGLLVAVALPATAQLTDQTQTPNTTREGIGKSLLEQIGAGVGDVMTPGSSVYVIKRDPFRSIRRGRQLFQRKFTMAQGVGPRTGDGAGDIELDQSMAAGLADSCAACHGRPRGAAGFGGDVFTRPDSRDAPHLFGLGLQEMLADEITAELRRRQAYALKRAADEGRPYAIRLESKGIRYGSLTAHPDGSVDTSRVEGVDPDLRVRPFFAEGGTISIREFVVGAFNNEMGLEAPDPLLAAAAAGARVVTPAGMVLDGSIDAIEAPPVTSPGDDGDGDGVLNEIDPAIVDHFEFYLLNYFKPGRDRLYGSSDYDGGGYDGRHRDGHRHDGDGDRYGSKGEYLMREFGCTSCHVQNLRLERDRRVADVETVHDSGRGIFNLLFATATPLFVEEDDGSGHPAMKLPLGGSFVVRDIFTDFKRHDLGPAFWERNFDGTLQKEFMTEPLWGVGTTAPYGHDGRSINLRAVIMRHGGEASRSRARFAGAHPSEQDAVLDFLATLVLFPPDDTASNLNPGNPDAPGFPQAGHGSIALGVLFNDPSEPE